jgi:hypothetical protein
VCQRFCVSLHQAPVLLEVEVAEYTKAFFSWHDFGQAFCVYDAISVPIAVLHFSEAEGVASADWQSHGCTRTDLYRLCLPCTVGVLEGVVVPAVHI